MQILVLLTIIAIMVMITDLLSIEIIKNVNYI